MVSVAARGRSVSAPARTTPTRSTLWSFLGRRIGFLLVAMWVAVTLNFIIPRLMPGNPAEALLARIGAKGPVTPSMHRELAAALGLPDGSIFDQYVHYLGNVVTLNFGVSYAYFPQPVGTLIANSILWTVLLVGTSTVITFIIGTGLGVAAAWRRGRSFDSVSTVGSTFISSFPYYVTAMLLVYVFALQLGWLPLNGGSSNAPAFTLDFLGDALQHAILPAIAIFIGGVGSWTLAMRNYSINVLGEDYIKFAQANGVKTRTILLRYVTKNAVLPQLTMFGIVFGNVVGGSLLVEIVFGYPGVGQLLENAVFNNDYPLMQALFLVITVTVLLANFVVDLIHVKLDPRVSR